MLAWCVLAPVHLRAEPTEASVVVVLSSSERRYSDALEGVRAAFSAEEPSPPLRVHVLAGSAGQDTLADVLVDASPRVVIALGTAALKAARAGAGDTPLVVGLSLATESAARKDAVVVSMEFPVRVQLEWLHRVLPKVRNVGVLYDPAANAERVALAEREASRLGLKLVRGEVKRPEDIPHALRILENQIDVLWGLSDATAISPATAKSLLVFSYRNRIPFVGLSDSWVKAGALYALDRDAADIGRQCGEQALALLRGTRFAAASQPPRTVLYSLNTRAASHMRTELSSALLQGARYVHE